MKARLKTTCRTAVLGLLAIATAQTADASERLDTDGMGRPAAQPSSLMAASGNGRYVLLRSFGTGLVQGAKPNMVNVVLRDRRTNASELIGSFFGEPCVGYGGGAVSQSGRYVAFPSCDVHSTGAVQQIYLRDRTAGTTIRVSQSSAGVPGNASSAVSSLSADGRVIGFRSFASNLVPGDTNGNWDAFTRDNGTGETTRVSVDADGREFPLASWTSGPSLSADGRVAAFVTTGDRLGSGNLRRVSLWRREPSTGVTRRLATYTGLGEAAALSADGSTAVAPQRVATSVDGEGASDALLVVKADGRSRSYPAAIPREVSIDAHGSSVAYSSETWLPNATTATDVRVRDLVTDRDNLIASDAVSPVLGDSSAFIGWSGRTSGAYVGYPRLEVARDLIVALERGIPRLDVHPGVVASLGEPLATARVYAGANGLQTCAAFDTFIARAGFFREVRLLTPFDGAVLVALGEYLKTELACP